MAKRRCTRREKAEEIAESLFTAGDTQKVSRLVLVRSGSTFGGWSEEFVADRIEAFLRGWTPAYAPRKKAKAKARKT